MVYLGLSHDLGLCGRRFKSPAQVARAIFRRRGWWPEIMTDDVGRVCLAYYIVGSKIIWRGMARFKPAAWHGDRAVIARRQREE
jgi:hypothetical protein